MLPSAALGAASFHFKGTECGALRKNVVCRALATQSCARMGV